MHNPPFLFSSLSHLHPLVSFVGKSIPSIPSLICPCILNLARFHGSFNSVTCCLRQVYDSLQLKLREPTAILAANDNLEIFLAHSTLGCSNFHAAPILDLQFRPLANSLLISRVSDSIRWTQYSPSESIFLCQCSLVFLSPCARARIRPFQGTPYYPFLRHSRLIYIPVSFRLVLSIRSPASRAAQSLLCSFVFVPATVLVYPRRESTEERKRLLRRSHRQRATTSASSRKSFIKFLITEIIVIEIELWRMMFAWTNSKSGKQQ